MKAFLIDPIAKIISPIELEAENILQQKYNILACRLVDRVRLDDDHLVWIDDEGAISGRPERRWLFGIREYDAPFCGRGLVLGDDGMGGDTDVTITIHELRYQIGFQR